jgi:hypothetical protein
LRYIVVGADARVTTAEGFLSKPPEDATRKTTITYRNFVDPLSGDVVLLPGDAARVYTEDLAGYIAKLVEYIQCFVSTHRLASQIPKAPLPVLPPGLVLDRHVERVLRVVGRTPGEDRDDETELLKYCPRPYFRESLNVPFVDFAASLAMMLMDYVKWAAASESDSLTAAAKAEIRTAMKFLIDESTYISGDGGTIGWSHVPGAKCRTDGTLSLPLLRHVYPTSKALRAIQRFCSDYRNDGLVFSAKELLPGVARWLRSLGKRDPKGFYYATDVERRPYLDDHCYATDAALALREMGVERADTVAVDAVKRLANQLNDGWGDLERLVVYDVRVENSYFICAGGDLVHTRGILHNILLKLNEREESDRIILFDQGPRDAVDAIYAVKHVLSRYVFHDFNRLAYEAMLNYAINTAWKRKDKDVVGEYFRRYFPFMDDEEFLMSMWQWEDEEVRSVLTRIRLGEPYTSVGEFTVREFQGDVGAGGGTYGEIRQRRRNAVIEQVEHQYPNGECLLRLSETFGNPDREDVRQDEWKRQRARWMDPDELFAVDEITDVTEKGKKRVELSKFSGIPQELIELVKRYDQTQRRTFWLFVRDPSQYDAAVEYAKSASGLNAEPQSLSPRAGSARDL